MKSRFTILFSLLLLPFLSNAQSSGLTEIYDIVEQMPRFPGCEHLPLSDDHKNACAEKKMLDFIYGNINYPASARQNGTEGMVIVSFVVRKTGEITDVEILREIGNGCGQEVMRMVKSMPDWVPGLQRGKPVNVQFNLPVKFKLEGRVKQNKKKDD